MTDKGHNQSDSGYANDPYGPHHRSATTTLIWSITLVLGVFVILAFFKKDLQMSLPSHLSPMLTTPSTPSSCDPPLPDLFSTSPPPSSHPKLIVASNAFQKQLEERFAQGGIDSIVLAVVTSEGSIFESTLGVVRANETDEEKKGKVTRDTVYRLASVSKVFNVLETLILRQRGLLSWQDPLTKFFPNFRYGPPSSSSSSRLPQQPITLHQLSCHLSGLGIIHPPGVVPNWPNDLKGSGHPPDNGNPFPSAQEVFDAVELYPKSAEGWAMTLYSNTGMGLLGMANVEAGLKGSGDEKRKASTVAELMRMDVFEPLGMERSGYEAGKYKVGEVAVSSVESKASEYDFKNAMNGAGGQFSSLGDLIKFMQTLLNPDRSESLIPREVVREWLRPVQPMFDDITEMGAPWEILKMKNKWGKVQRLYEKWGQLAGYHTSFAINPTAGYGVIVLMTGPYPDSQDFTMRAVRQFQPVFDELLEVSSKDFYAGRWTAGHQQDGGPSEAIVKVERGTIFVERLILNGTDTLNLLQGSPPKTKPASLWNTGRNDEFKLALGVPGFNDAPDYGCLIYMLGFDPGYSRGYAIDMLYWTGDGKVEERVLHFPAAGISLRRI